MESQEGNTLSYFEELNDSRKKQEQKSILRINSDNPFCEKICNKISDEKL